MNEKFHSTIGQKNKIWTKKKKKNEEPIDKTIIISTNSRKINCTRSH